MGIAAGVGSTELLQTVPQRAVPQPAVPQLVDYGFEFRLEDVHMSYTLVAQDKVVVGRWTKMVVVAALLVVAVSLVLLELVVELAHTPPKARIGHLDSGFL